MVVRLATLALDAARGGWRRLPATARRRLEDRFFYAVFQTTRVTNDAYGWPAPPPGPADASAAPDVPPGAPGR